MTRVLDEITRAYPSLSGQLSWLATDKASDSRLMAELASYVVDSFEAGRIEAIRPGFELAENLIANGQETKRHAAMIGFLETV